MNEDSSCSTSDAVVASVGILVGVHVGDDVGTGVGDDVGVHVGTTIKIISIIKNKDEKGKRNYLELVMLLELALAVS